MTGRLFWEENCPESILCFFFEKENIPLTTKGLRDKLERYPVIYMKHTSTQWYLDSYPP